MGFHRGVHARDGDPHASISLGQTRRLCSDACMAAQSRKPEQFRSSSSSARFSALFAMTAFSAYDHRIGWSTVPTAVCLIGDVLVVAGLVHRHAGDRPEQLRGAPPSGGDRPESGLPRSLQVRAAPDVRRQPDHDDGHTACRSAPTGGFSSSSRACWCWSSASSMKKSCSPKNWPDTANTRSACTIGWCPTCGSAHGPKPGTHSGPAVATSRRSAVRTRTDSRRRQTTGNRHRSTDRHRRRP